MLAESAVGALPRASTQGGDDMDARPGIDRRGFLLLGGGVAAAAVLAACTPGLVASPTPTATATGWVPPAEPMPLSLTWGAATSAFQVEGSTTVDGRGPSVWDTFAATPGK